MEKDDIYRELKSLTRQRLRLIWEMAQMGVVLNDAEPSARARRGLAARPMH